jgi:hypothetical protein
MAKIKAVSLTDVRRLGAIRFIRAEWKHETSRCALIQYTVNGEQRDLALRLDIDKKVILDPLNEADIVLTDEMIRDRTETIWNIVAKARAKDSAFSPLR